MNDLNIVEFKAKLDKSEDFVLIDVREAWEHQEFNMGGENIPLGVLTLKLDDLEEAREKEVIVYCKMGGRSGMAKQILIQSGFTNVRNLLGGADSWIATFGKSL
ncbi:MAG: rhodanese-like domain-containing protein [Bacteroidota bacterium]